jgi:hypothetical protein
MLPLSVTPVTEPLNAGGIVIKFKNALPKVAALLLGQQTASAGCAPNPYYQYRCIDGYRYRRTCQTPPDCGPNTCSPYTVVGEC